MNNVHFAGVIHKKQVRDYLSHAIASLITFKPVEILNTSSPNKLCDALAAGVPVIQTTKGWIKDLVDNEKIGINVSPNDPDQMADAMVSLSSAIKAGLSLAQALDILAEQAPRPICQEFHQLVGEYQLGKPMEPFLVQANQLLRL